MHVSYYVRDLSDSIAFYNHFLGTEPSKVEEGYVKFELEQPALILSLIERPGLVQAGFGHLGIQVDSREEMDRRLAVAEKQGLRTRTEIGTTCCYAVQDKFWVADPDGYQWEVYYFHEDAAFMDPHAATEAEACCSGTVEKVPAAKAESACC